MGMYDDFIGRCPKCGKEAYSQTKLFECAMIDIKEGDSIGVAYHIDDMDMCCKNQCECGADLVAKIRDGKFMGFTNNKPDHVEGLWGGLSPAEATENEEK